MAEERTTPKLRFKGFTADWEQRKLGDFGSVAMNKRIFKKQTHGKDDVPFFKIGTFGKKPDAFISRSLFQEYKNKYPYPEKGDLLISASGSIGRVIEYKGQDAYYQDSNIVWLKHNDKLLNLYLKAYYQIIHWNGIEGSTIKRLYNKNILATKIAVPSIEEQNKLGKLINLITKLISLQQRKIASLNQVKTALLQKMFADKSQPKPTLRFNGYIADWKKYKLDQLAQYRRGSFPQPYGRKEWYGGVDSMPFVQVVDVNDNLRLKNKTKEKISKIAQSKSVFVPKDTVIITIQGSIGRVAVTQYDAYIDRTLLIFQAFKVNIDKYFFAYNLKKVFNIEKQKAPGGTIKTITKQALSNFKLYIPLSSEQQRIGKLLCTIDKVLFLQQLKLKKLKKVKQFLLQNMFI